MFGTIAEAFMSQTDLHHRAHDNYRNHVTVRVNRGKKKGGLLASLKSRFSPKVWYPWHMLQWHTAMPGVCVVHLGCVASACPCKRGFRLLPFPTSYVNPARTRS